MMEGGFERTFLKFGQKHTEKGMQRLEMVVPDAKVKDLIDFINNNNPTTYDYPVPDAIAIPISTGNKEFLTWAKDAKKIDFGKIYPKTTPYG